MGQALTANRRGRTAVSARAAQRKELIAAGELLKESLAIAGISNELSKLSVRSQRRVLVAAGLLVLKAATEA